MRGHCPANRCAHSLAPEVPLSDQTVSADRQIDSIVASMSNEEKVDRLSGFGLWKTAGIPAHGIKPVVMTDGTYGVRYSIPQIDGDERGGMDIDAFLSVVNQRASDVAVAWGEMKPATCFPYGSAMGNSWDEALMHRLGTLLGKECCAMGVHILLGPGINIRRTPLAGRSYGYYSEDPVVTGKLSAAVIEGIQSQGVGTSLKHFACNNSEVERTTMDTVVEERALREIYLKGFEIAIKQSAPWRVYAGAARPIMVSRGRVSIMHGSDGLAGSTLPEPTIPLASGHAATEISRIARAEDKLHICATGPLTNLALALLLDPELPDFVSALTIMGGAAFCPGNTTPLAEFNFAVDPHAAAIVFDSGIEITMLGLDVTRQATVTEDMIRQVQATDTPVAREAAHLLINYGSKDPCLHDPAAIAWMLKPDIFQTMPAHVSIYTDSGPAAGQVIAAVSERHLAGRVPNCSAAIRVDADAFRMLFVTALNSAIDHASTSMRSSTARSTEG